MHVADKNASVCTRVWWRESFPEDEGDKRLGGPTSAMWLSEKLRSKA